MMSSKKFFGGSVALFHSFHYPTLPSTNWITPILREFSLSWQFIRYDISSTVMPCLLFTVAAWANNPVPADLLFYVLQSVLYFLVFVFVFCVANQITGIDEDRINKPDRPLVRGVVSLEGAKIRWMLGMMLFLALGGLLGVAEWSFLWIVVVVLYNFCGWARHWFTKNLAMSLGVIAQLAAAWQIVTPITSWNWIIVAAAVIFPLVSLQDIRDIAGDRLMNRKTFPLLFGETFTRVKLLVGFIILPVIVHVLLMQPAGLSWYVLFCDTVLALLSLLIAVRVFFCRNPKADHLTYMLFTYWYCAMLAAAIIVL